MLRLERIAVRTRVMGSHPLTRRAKIMITISNMLTLLGVVVLLYVGGVYANAEYGRYAARGDTDVPAPPPVMPAQAAPSIGLGLLSQARGAEEPAPFAPAQLPDEGGAKAPEGRIASVVPDVATIGGQQVAIWQVAEYAVGHHLGSANPGDGENIVLAGHVGGYGKVFRDLYKLEVGDAITLYSGGVQHSYTVSEVHIVDEEGVSAEQQAENARYIAETGQEAVTLVTCWPPSGKLKFSQRIIVRAVPSEQHPQNQS